ncbi:MAG TPA: hypothetical protein PLB21_08520 [Actinomycetota bacterium]|nr:hypothetical protein [Actinomycetota bacterium]
MQEGPVVPGERLASSWGLTRQALAPAAQHGEIFAVKVGNRLYDPQAFLGMDRRDVATLCRALGELDATGKLMFWLREHGSQAGQKVADALGGGHPAGPGGTPGRGWAQERGAARVAAAA